MPVKWNGKNFYNFSFSKALYLMGILAHFEDSPMVMSRDGFFLHYVCLVLSYAVFSLGKLFPSLSPDMRLVSPFYFAVETQIHFCKRLLQHSQHRPMPWPAAIVWDVRAIFLFRGLRKAGHSSN